MDRNRILELAIEELNKQKAGIDAEIETIRAELKGTGSAVGSAGTRRGRMSTHAQRKAHSLGMKKYWAVKKAQAAKLSPETKTVPPANAKVRAKTEAQKKALSAAMKKAWKKRKAAAAATITKAKSKTVKAPK
jgi:septal ring factor EnvC (AmiA/AmiB activator)